MRHRAVLLAHLLTDRERLNRGSVAVVGEDLSEDLGRRGAGIRCGDGWKALLDEAHPALGEGANRVLSRRLGEEPKGLNREVVVLLVELPTSGLGEDELLGWAPPTPQSGRADLARLDLTVQEQLLEVSADRCRRQLKAISEDRGSGRSVDMDRPDVALTRRAIGVHEFHNASVALFIPTLKEGDP